jgi:hypothetical protein
MKALLKNIFHPTNDHLSLSAVHLSVTEEMAKDIKAMNFGYSNNLSYDFSHHGLSPFSVIGVSMATASHQHCQAD